MSSQDLSWWPGWDGRAIVASENHVVPSYICDAVTGNPIGDAVARHRLVIGYFTQATIPIPTERSTCPWRSRLPVIPRHPAFGIEIIEVADPSGSDG
ncbi:hypothetical protein Ptr86124_011172 [Pyrenophora tritici-repentis]|uniref:Uncharacterized protein n=1 Tax=Pyrenophora tritici-repentis TaxID=45151 RepID=A0A922SSN6_9PLEO|nr:hypothetical protein Ptr86124_011172 [Pyrenophora tritici-repentis]